MSGCPPTLIEPAQAYKIDTVLNYDAELGELHIEDSLMKDVIHIRAGLVETATRAAIIEELEKFGYVVLGPYPNYDWDRW